MEIAVELSCVFACLFAWLVLDAYYTWFAFYLIARYVATVDVSMSVRV